MDPQLNECLYQVVHLCLEVCMFLNQLYLFERELSKLLSSSKISQRTFVSILDRFALTLIDLNNYHQNEFFSYYCNVLISLSRDFSGHVLGEKSHDDSKENLDQEIDRLNFYLHHHRPFSEDIFHHLHQLHITCSLCSQYRQHCTAEEFYDRFVYLRIDLFTNLIELNHRLRSLVQRINRKFKEQRKNLSTKDPCFRLKRISTENYHLIRTILLWILVILILGCYFSWPIVRERPSEFGWPM